MPNSGAPRRCRVRSRDSRTTPPVDEHLSKFIVPSLGSCLCSALVRSIPSSIAPHTLVAACKIDFGFVHWRALNRQHHAVDYLAAQLHQAQRHAPVDAVQSIGKCERTLGSASKASNRNISCEVHFEAGCRGNYSSGSGPTPCVRSSSIRRLL